MHHIWIESTLFRLLFLYARVKLPWTTVFTALPTICFGFMVCIFYGFQGVLLVPCKAHWVFNVLLSHDFCLLCLQVSESRDHLVPLHVDNTVSLWNYQLVQLFAIRISDCINVSHHSCEFTYNKWKSHPALGIKENTYLFQCDFFCSSAYALEPCVTWTLHQQ